MPTIGLIVEGDYDEAAIPVLLRRCRDGVTLKTRICRGSVIGKFPGILAELGRSYRPEKVLVIADADGKQPDKILDAISSRNTKPYPFEVVPLVIVQMLEAWLVADPSALKKVLDIEVSIKQPEAVRDPKRRLESLMAAKRGYTPAIARRLAEEIDLDTLRRACPTFNAFHRAIRHS